LRDILQEVSVATFAEAMPTVAFGRINRLAGAIPTILTKALFLLESPGCFRQSMRRTGGWQKHSVLETTGLEKPPALE